MVRSCRRSIRLDLVIPLSAVLLLAVSGQQQPGAGRPATLSRPPPTSRLAAATTSRPAAREQIDRERQADAAELVRPPSPVLTITPEERLELRKSLMELSKRRQVTAVKPTMSPDVISTTNVYHFFAKKRFNRVKNPTRATTTTTTTESPTTSPGSIRAAFFLKDDEIQP